jgi:hypothetical protein
MLETMPNYDNIENTEIIKSISRPDFDLDKYCHLTLEDASLRDEIINHMLHAPDIMVYYHCFYVVEKACQQNLSLFSKYWPEFCTLLKHANSYHRDFGLILIAILTQVETEKRILEILPDYLQHACDPKFMTARCCLQNCRKIIQAKPQLKNKIVTALLEYEKHSPYTAAQKALLKFDLLEIIHQICAENLPEDQYKEYILNSLESSSPMTRKKAKELAIRFNLISR